MEHLTLETFQEKIMNLDSDELQGDIPVILDFYADWCVPCRTLSPTLEELSKEYAGKVKIYKIDTEEEMEIATKFNIRNLPSVIFIPRTGEKQMKTGVHPKIKYKEVIESII